MSKVNTEDIYRLSPMQEGMLFHTISDPKSRVYFQQESYTIGTGLNVDALRRAWQQVVDRHPILRTGFIWERREKPLQIVYKSVSLPWEQLDWRGFEASEQAERLNAFLEQDREQGFNLSRPPLLRLTLIQMAEEQYSFIWRFHHVLMDQWSVSLLFKEVFTIYGALCQGGQLELERPKPYRDYIAWLRRQDLSKAETFWRDALRGFTAPTPLKSKGAGGSLSEREAEYTKQKIKLSAATTAALQAAARKQQLTLNTIVQGAWALLLSRYSGEKDVVFGTSISGRPAELAGADSMIGLFINTLPARVQVNQDAVFVDWLKEFQYQQMTARQYLYSPLVQIQAWSEVPGGQPLFESLLVFENAPREDHLSQGGAPFQIKPGASFDQSQYPLTLVVWPGPELSMEIWSKSREFDSTTIARILQQWQLVLEGFVADPTQRLSNLSLLTEEERQQLLLPLHSAPADFPSHLCLHHLFEDQVRRNPLATALAADSRSLSYLDLNRRANQLARFLIAHHHIGHGSLVAICLHHSFETFVALLAVLKTGAAYVPFDPLHPPARLAFMLDDSQAALLLTEHALRERFTNTATPLLSLDTQWESVSSESDEDLSLDLTSDALAYVIYTSGSTGQPKGVAITNRSLVNYVSWACDVYVRGEQLSFALYSSLAFDLTVTSLYVPLVSGGRVEIYVADGGESALLKVLEADAADVVKATPSHLALMKEAARGKSRIKRLIVGGEALRTELAREVTAALGGEVEIYNEYGPTEATVGCTVHLYDVERDVREDVPIGRAGANMQVYVLDEARQLVGEGVVGEVYIGGEGLAAGYLGREELTREKFVKHPFAEGGRLYRSGDLGRRLGGGVLEYLGRRDEQVKYHGYRVELNEIRSALNEHPQVRDSVVAIMKDHQGMDVMVGYYVSRQEIDGGELRARMGERIIEATIPGIFVHLKKLPLTINGKVNYSALPTLEDSRRKVMRSSVLPRTPIEAALAKIWADILGTSQIGIYDNFFELGGHSLVAAQVISRVREALHVELALRELFDAPTVAGLAVTVQTQMRARQGEQASSISAASRETELPLSFAQQRLWFIDQLEPGSPFYNIPAVVRVEGTLDVAALERALNEVVRRHEALRTTFAARQGRPVQLIAPSLTLALSMTDLRQLPANEREEEARRLAAAEAKQPFDLARGPLLRVTLLQLDAGEYLLLFTMHHIISDGWSLGVLVREVAVLYESFCHGRSSPLPALPIQYADYAVWQREQLSGEMMAAQMNYWKQRLGGTLPALELPTDRARPLIQSYRGATRTFVLSADLLKSLNELSRHEGVTLFMLLLAAFQTLLHRYTGQDDIRVGSPVANRPRVETEDLIGCFLNTLVLRTDLGGNPGFRELLRRVREMTLGAYAHHDLPFEAIVEELQPERKGNYTPLFQVWFVFNHAPMQALELPDLKLSPVGVESASAQFDLTLAMSDFGTEIGGGLTYNTDLFDADTIDEMVARFISLLEVVTADPNQRLLDIPLGHGKPAAESATPHGLRPTDLLEDQFVL